MEVEMFGDGRLRVPSTSPLAGQVLQPKKGPFEHLLKNSQLSTAVG